MTNSSFLKKLLFAFGVVVFVSCSDDFNEIGSEIVGDDLHTDMIRHIVDVTAYDRPLGAVQSNNLSQNQLGVYNNAIFGKTVSHFVTQLELASENPTLFEPTIDSVYLYIPYNIDASATTTGTDGKTTYELDKNFFFGDLASTFNLEIYRNGFYLRDSDPAAADKLQRYYSDDKVMVDNLKVGAPLHSDPGFKFRNTEWEIRANVTDGTQNKLVEKKAPGLFTYLEKNYFQEALMSNANRGNLLNNNLFRNYFRGLYFKVTQGNGAVMGLPKFSEGTIIIKYHDYQPKTDGTTGYDPARPRISKTITLNLKGNTINFFENTYNTGFESAIATSSPTEGDSRLYLKGGAGSMAIINIDEEQLKALTVNEFGQKVLINEANLVFNVDTTSVDAIQSYKDDPLRIYLYDLKNRKPLYDYLVDGSRNNGSSKLDKGTHGGIKVAKGEFSRASQYKIKLTNHINNIIKGDSTNVKLGLVITDDINIVGNGNLKTPFTEDATVVKQTPVSSTSSLFGTILYGSNKEVPQDKRLKLEIYYTKPK